MKHRAFLERHRKGVPSGSGSENIHLFFRKEEQLFLQEWSLYKDKSFGLLVAATTFDFCPSLRSKVQRRIEAIVFGLKKLADREETFSYACAVPHALLVKAELKALAKVSNRGVESIAPSHGG